MARGPRARTAPDLVLVVDKDAGMTSHDVVGRVRRLVGSRKVGHAGTLDPMATGVLVLGVERATRLLSYLAAGDKEYEATVRLGAATVTDDAEGEVLETADASGVDVAAVRAGLAALTGEISQRPSAVSAVKVGGVRSYARVRAGEEVELAARPVTVSAFDLLATRREGGYLDLDVRVVCSPGTYVRALARDLGAALGVGGHLTALRRTRSGSFGIAAARTLAELDVAGPPYGVPLVDAVAAELGVVTVDAATAERIRHGARVPLAAPARGPVGVVDPDGVLLSLATPDGDLLRPLVVLAP